MNLLEEFRDRASILKDVHYNDAAGRLIDLLKWLEGEPITKRILDELKSATNIAEIFQQTHARSRPRTNTREEIAAAGLHLIELCRSEKTQLYKLCLTFGISPAFQSNSNQDYCDTGMRDYVVPFLVYVEKELVKASEAHSVAAVAEGRFAGLLTLDTQKLLPKTASNFERISGEFLRTEGDVMWQNVGNSCRQLLIDLSAELCEVCGIERPAETKEADVKAILKHMLGKIGPAGRYRETLEGLSQSVWDHTQSLLHRPTTKKEEAMRVYLWTGLLVSEFVQMVRAYNEA